MKNNKKNLIPVILCVAAIAVIGIVGVIVVSHFSSSGKRMNAYTYYGMESSDEVALVVNDTVLDAKGITRDGQVYLDYKTVWDYIDCGYYWDENTGVLMLTLPGETMQWSPDDGSGAVITDNDGAWISADVIRDNSDVDISILEEPARVVIRNTWSGISTCTVLKNAKIRYRAGRKSEIVTEAAAGDTLVLLDKIDDWDHVSTPDGYTGYVKSDCVTEDAESALSHETDQRFVFDKIQSQDPVVMAWQYTDSTDNNQYLSDYISEASGMNTVSPTWFGFQDLSGAISSYASADYVKTAHEAGLKVWGMLGDTDGQQVSTGEVLADSSARAEAIAELLQIAEETGLDGLNIDFESITEEQAPQYLQFLKELSQAAHEKNLVISVDNFVPTYTWYYRRGEQAKCVDYIVIMGYDEHTAGSEEIGSVASIDFVEQGITDTLEEVDASSVINAVPFYGRCWVERYGSTVPDTTALSMADQQAFISEHGITLEWDASVGQNVGSSDDGSARYSIWAEDSDSMTCRLEMMKQYDLAGMACWRLGLEDSEIWNVIKSVYLGQ